MTMPVPPEYGEAFTAGDAVSPLDVPAHSIRQLRDACARAREEGAAAERARIRQLAMDFGVITETGKPKPCRCKPGCANTVRERTLFADLLGDPQ